jgi:hypothetical protein
MESCRLKIAAERGRKSLLYVKKKKQKDFYILRCIQFEAEQQTCRERKHKRLLVLFFRKAHLA